jgi:hypothetical protein
MAIMEMETTEKIYHSITLICLLFTYRISASLYLLQIVTNSGYE